ncbi:hypothetical protein [Thermococcus sp. AM4]|uniref:DUF4760 domain-containing protein n=1 Tax=Thermococcus sp. (strain AM4) TaxID=246969 RepID=UPI0001870707|nr:hypothetical protein [Thermococcus sp. AM4]EEB73858.1 conserved hypothetical protein [Thermococcus sp. AM4]
MRHVKLIALISSVMILIISTIAWSLTKNFDATNVVLTAITTIATVIMAVTIYQLDLTLQQLRFDALNKTYEFLSNDIKQDLNIISQWAKEKRSPDEIFSGKDHDKNWQIVRFVSVAFNKVGYYVYKGFIDETFIQEEFGGLVVRSFIAIRPYLEYIRNKSEPEDKPWFMRRFYLMIVVVCENYLRKNFPEYLKRLVNEYGNSDIKRDYDSGSLVPKRWLAKDVYSWLQKKGYLQ